MICTSVCLSPRVVYSVGLVEPVELHGIWRAQVELQRGTGGTGVGLEFRLAPRARFHRSHRLVPPKIAKKA